MKLEELVKNAQESITIRRVFGEPFEKEGITFIPAARVKGGGGGGGGHDERAEGEGGGFGMDGSPTGAYVIQNGKIGWQPAVDVNKMLGTIATVLIAWMFTRVRIERIRAKAARG